MTGEREPIYIVGGGICGLGIGWYLTRAGRAVTVLERDRAGRGATWAAAGMLAPQVEAEPGEEGLQDLLLESRDMWADFAAELEAASGETVGYRTEGTLVVALDRDDAEQLQFQYEFQRDLGLELEWLSGYEARQREPHLARTVVAAIYSALDHQVDNRKVAVALRKAFLRAGGELCEQTEVQEVVVDGGRVRGVRTADELLPATTVVLAAGAWSRTIGGLPDAVRPPVRPVKGQMLAVQMPERAPLLEHVIWSPEVYLVPCNDGRLLVGATVEEQGFDTELTAGGLFELLRGAWETLPGIYDLPITEMWTGLRPGSRDDAPILGPTDVEGLVLATGHHRNGILLAPVTAKAVSDFILTGELPEIAQPFTLQRFADGRQTADDGR